MRDNVDEGDQALDSLFGPYDFLDSGLAQLPPESEPSSGRMSESPEDDKIRGQGVPAAFPDPTTGAMLPPEDRFQPVKSEEDRKPGSTDGSEVSSEQAQAPLPRGVGPAPRRENNSNRRRRASSRTRPIDVERGTASTRDKRGVGRRSSSRIYNFL